MGAPTIISLDKKFMRKRPLAVSAEASCRKEEPYDEELLVVLSRSIAGNLVRFREGWGEHACPEIRTVRKAY
jgi:hypothetical protein